MAIFYITRDSATGDVYAEYDNPDVRLELDENGDLWYVRDEEEEEVEEDV